MTSVTFRKDPSQEVSELGREDTQRRASEDERRECGYICRRRHGHAARQAGRRDGGLAHHLDRGWLLMLQMDETGHADEHRVVT